MYTLLAVESDTNSIGTLHSKNRLVVLSTKLIPWLQMNWRGNSYNWFILVLQTDCSKKQESGQDRGKYTTVHFMYIPDGGSLQFQVLFCSGGNYNGIFDGDRLSRWFLPASSPRELVSNAEINLSWRLSCQTLVGTGGGEQLGRQRLWNYVYIGD